MPATVLAALLLSSCATPRSAMPALPPSATAEGATFILVPHAETLDGDADDPALSAAGQARAQALKSLLADAPLIAVYATEFHRTQDTAAPAAAAHAQAVHAYFSRAPWGETARQWQQRHRRGTVLVVGDAVAVAPLADALCSCVVPPLRDDEVDRLVRVHLDRHGKAEADNTRYGAAPP